MEKTVNEQGKQPATEQGKKSKEKKFVNPVIAWGSIVIELIIVGAVSLFLALA